MSIETRKTKNGVVYDVRYRVAGKSSKHASKTFRRMTDAREFLAVKSKELLDSRASGAYVGKFEETTMAEEAEFWLEQMKIELSSGWYRRAEGMIRQFLIPKYGHLSPDKFNIQFVRRIQADIKGTANQKSTNRYLSNSSVNRFTEVMCAILNYSVRTQRIPSNPARGYRKLPDDRVEISYWEADEVRDFLTFLSKRFPKGHKEHWVYVAILVALNCGIRAGELWGLMPQDVKDETLYIKRQWRETEKRFDLPKGKRNRQAKDRLPYRHTVLHEFVRDELHAIIEQRQVRPDQTIFFSEAGQPRGHRSFGHRFDRLVKVWGGRRIRFHDLRHTAITLWVHAGINLKVIQEMAGHESITTTMGYVHMIGGSVNRVSRYHLVSDQTEPRLLLGKSDENERNLEDYCVELRSGSERGVR